jgi:hypothetical protein
MPAVGLGHPPLLSVAANQSSDGHPATSGGEGARSWKYSYDSALPLPASVPAAGCTPSAARLLLLRLLLLVVFLLVLALFLDGIKGLMAR